MAVMFFSNAVWTISEFLQTLLNWINAWSNASVRMPKFELLIANFDSLFAYLYAECKQITQAATVNWIQESPSENRPSAIKTHVFPLGFIGIQSFLKIKINKCWAVSEVFQVKGGWWVCCPGPSNRLRPQIEPLLNSWQYPLMNYPDL